MVQTKKWLGYGMVLILAACKHSDAHDSELLLKNGKDIPEQEIPAVTAIVSGGLCTATFVSDTTMVTAAHCVGRGDAQGIVSQPVVLPKRGNVRSVKVLAHPLYPTIPQRGPGARPNPYDVAVVIFPAGTGKDILPILNRQPVRSETITVVGYGERGFGQGGSGTKRMGTNKVLQIDDYLRFDGRFRRAGEAAGENVTVGRGDSGGPVLVDNSLAGVGSTYDGGNDVSTYINLMSASSRSFLRAAIAQGANIPSLDAAPGSGGGAAIAQSSDIFALPLDESDAPALAIGVAEAYTDVVVCVGGEAASCTQGAAGWQRLTKSASKAGRTLYRSTGLTPQSGKLSLTVVANDGTKKVYRKVLLERR